MGYYDYEQLKEKALQFQATPNDINELGKWFDEYGDVYWNGEYYDVDEQHRLFPVFDEHYDESGELISADVIGYEFR